MCSFFYLRKAASLHQMIYFNPFLKFIPLSRGTSSRINFLYQVRCYCWRITLDTEIRHQSMLTDNCSSSLPSQVKYAQVHTSLDLLFKYLKQDSSVNLVNTSNWSLHQGALSKLNFNLIFSSTRYRLNISILFIFFNQ